MSDWIEQDDGGGNKYYYNQVSGESSWDPPGSSEHHDAPANAAVDVGKTWYECEDEQGQKYYYNAHTQECEWEKPSDYVEESNDGEAHGVKMPPGLQDRMKAAFEGGLKKKPKQTKEHKEKLSAAMKAHMLSHEEMMSKANAAGRHWVEVYDSTHHAFYYYDNVSGESSWDKPDSYVMAADDELMSAVIKIQSMWRGKMAKQTVSVKKQQKRGDDMAHDAAEAAKAGKAPKWAAVDDGSGNVYFYNNITEECQWEKPADFDGAEGIDAKLDVDLQAHMKKAFEGKLKKEKKVDSAHQKKIDVAMKAHMASHEQMLSQIEDGSEHWVEVYDPAHDAFYYYGQYSGEMSWDKPEHYVMAADDELMSAVIKIQSMWRGKIARGEVSIKKKQQQKWVEHADEESGDVYYWNTETDECVWEKPTDFIPGAKEDEAMHAKMQAAFEGKLKLLDKDTQMKLDAAKKAQAEAEAKRDQQVAEGGHHWVETFDPAHDAFYYFCTYTNEVTWDKPESYVMAADDEMMTAVIKIQCAWRAKIARGEIKVKKQKQQLWVVAIDEESGQEYYYNTETHDVTWDRPADFVRGNEGDEEVRTAAHQALEGKLRKVDKEMHAKTKAAIDKQNALREGMSRRWASAYDPSHDAYYYYDLDNNECVWEKPDDFVETAEFPEMQAAISIQCAWRTKIAKREVRAKAEKAEKEKAEKGKAEKEKIEESFLDFEVEHAAESDQAVAPTPEVTSTENEAKKAEEARKKMEALKAAEDQMKKEMEELQRAREKKKREKRAKQKAERAAQAKAALEEEQRVRTAAAERWQEEQVEKRRRKAEAQEQAQSERKAVRATQLAALKTKVDARVAQEAEAAAAKAQSARQASEERERARREVAEEAERKRVADVAQFRKKWKQGLKDAEGMLQRRQDRLDREAQERAAARQRDVARRLRLQSYMDKGVASLQESVRRGCSVERLEFLILSDVDKEKRKAKSQNQSSPKSLPASTSRVLDQQNDKGETMLHIAAWKGDAEQVKFLLSVGASVNVRDCTVNNTTALHEAARGGWGQIVQLLLDHGADPMTPDVAGDTALHWAVRNQHRTAAKPLLAHRKGKALFAIENDRGRTAAFYAEVEGVVRLLADYQKLFSNKAGDPSVEADSKTKKKTNKRRPKSGSKKSKASRKASAKEGDARRIYSSVSTPAF